MIESIYPSSEKSGLPPGSLVHIGEVIDTDISLSIINYGKEKFESKKIDSIDEIIKHKNSQEMTWLIVEGLKNTETVERIGQVFGIHQLVLEDILNTNQSELHWKWAYPLTWASFLVIPLILFFFFKRKKWL